MQIAYVYKCGDCHEINLTLENKGARFWCKCGGLVRQQETRQVDEFFSDHLK